MKLRNFEVGNYFQFGWKCQPEVLLSWWVDKEGGILNFQEGEIPEEGEGERGWSRNKGANLPYQLC